MSRKWLVLSVALGALSVFAQSPKNIILFIGDGMSLPQFMTAEEFSRKTGGESLAFTRMTHQAITRTCSANAMTTDSAAAATAIACGEKTRNGSLGVDPQGKPVESCAALAKARGKKVGILTTVTINHATPGGFYAHRKNRGDGYGVGLDLVASGFDYFAGGGIVGHNDKKHPQYHGDIYELAGKAGYNVVRGNRAAFDALRPGMGKTLVVATEGVMPYAIDKADWKGVPSLAELTAKGIELLKNENGFFMMVEGGKIDHSCHANDAATELREVLAFDEAIKVGLAFAEQDGETLVMITGDHETGGMAMGYAGRPYAMERLAAQKASAGNITDHILKCRARNLDDIVPYLTENFGLVFDDKTGKEPMAVTKEERGELEAALAYDLELARAGKKDDEAYDAKKITRLPATVKAIVSHKCGIGWTSGSHTALPVMTMSKGPSAEAFSGFMENTEISKRIKKLIGE